MHLRKVVISVVAVAICTSSARAVLTADRFQAIRLIEDVYDRVVCGEILKEDLFARNCSSLTATTYRTRKKSPQRLVYTVQRVHKIATNGRVGIPHWKAKKRLWPGAFPVMTFE